MSAIRHSPVYPRKKALASSKHRYRAQAPRHRSADLHDFIVKAIKAD